MLFDMGFRRSQDGSIAARPASISKEAPIVEQDVAISAKVLQPLTSAFFNATREIADIETAVSYLGTTTLQNLTLLMMEVFRTFPTKPAHSGLFVRKTSAALAIERTGGLGGRATGVHFKRRGGRPTSGNL